MEAWYNPNFASEPREVAHPVNKAALSISSNFNYHLSCHIVACQVFFFSRLIFFQMENLALWTGSDEGALPFVSIFRRLC